MHGKGQKFGPINRRDTRNSEAWCKHVQAALANTEALAEAQEITARTFGKAPRVEPTPEPAPVAEPVTVKAEPVSETAADRLRKLEAEAEALREEIRAEESAELRESVKALVDRFDYDRVREALRDAS